MFLGTFAGFEIMLVVDFLAFSLHLLLQTNSLSLTFLLNVPLDFYPQNETLLIPKINNNNNKDSLDPLKSS